MKKILIVATGGTIGSSLKEGCRRLTPELAKSTLMENYLRDGGTCRITDFEDSKFEAKTLSENMTKSKLMKIAEHIRSFELSNYSGVIVLHGTDTLDFTATLFSMLFCATPIPIILVSGNRPPEDKSSNATVNFSAAVGLIEKGIAPNVYVTYRNSDGQIRLYLGKYLLGCGDFSEDFYTAENKGVFTLDGDRDLGENDASLIENISHFRPVHLGADMENIHRLDANVLLIKPYVGLDYSRISLDGIDGIVHGTYHSGTLCVDEAENNCSAIELAKRAREKGIPFYLAPCKLDEEQYESAFQAEKQGIIPLYVPTSLAYWALHIAISMGLKNEEISEYITKLF